MPHSAIYEGSVRHRRNRPRVHQFDFRFFMLLLDLEELPGVLPKPFWSTGRWGLCRFNEQDHLKQYIPANGPCPSLRQRALEALDASGVRDPIGPIRVLTQLSYLGFSMNPVSFFYCYDEAGESVTAIIAEVNNTPWGEQHLYVVPSTAVTARAAIRSTDIKKDFHVSPFMTLDMNYRMAFSPPGERLAVKIENHPWLASGITESAANLRNGNRDRNTSQPSDDRKWMDVTMALERRPLTVKNMNWLLIKYPAISFQVFAGIYWQALRLYLKKIPFVPHPRKLDAQAANDFLDRESRLPHADVSN